MDIQSTDRKLDKDLGGPAIFKEAPSIEIRSELERLGLHYHNNIWCLPSTPESLLEAVKHFRFRPDDTMIVSYPKAGVYWMADLVWLIQNDLDIASSGRTPVGLRVPFLEHRNAGLEDPLALLDSRISPRLMKTHLQSEQFSETFAYQEPKSIVLLRNPKDTLAAIYMFYKSNPYFEYKGSWCDFYTLFMENALVEGNYIESTLSWWNRRHDDNVLVVKLCDILSNPRVFLTDVATFMNVTLADDQITELSGWLNAQLTVEKSRENAIWRDFFQEEQLRHLQENVYFELARNGLIFL